MNPNEDELRKFIWENINSVEQITVLGLLSSESARDWTIPSITQHLRSSESSIRMRLDDLYAKGVLHRPETGNLIRFSPASEEMARLILMLLEAYRTYPNRIIDLIYGRPSEALHAFADSFKLRKD